ncbi:CLUMA_CG021189, isoform A [Clunio marinus]|uniref:CLUMA_CG021189, isoform A n=1 Tax=Clunio marinus TaxID=568069 RepID=A0A1J1J8A6_9DIPT|nr:CLUMA_CG021189, isoform A [Clunio marinus]
MSFTEMRFQELKNSLLTHNGELCRLSKKLSATRFYVFVFKSYNLMTQKNLKAQRQPHKNIKSCRT